MSTAEEAAAAWAIAWELDKAAYKGARKAYRGAQVLGMKIQNWKYKGAGATAATPATTTASKPAGKQWSTEEVTETEHATYHRTRTEKRTR